MLDYQPGDMVRVRNGGISLLLSVQATRNARGLVDVQYTVRDIGGARRLVKSADILGKVFAPSPSWAKNAPKPVRERPSTAKKRLRQRPSKMEKTLGDG